MDWAIALSTEDYEVIPCEPIGPLHLHLLRGQQMEGPTGVVLRQTGPPVSMLRHAALAAFWDLDLKHLRMLLELLGLQEPTPASLYGLVQALVQHIVQPASEQELLDILALRGQIPDTVEAMPGVAEVMEDLMAPEEQQDAQACGSHKT
eukprot:10021571-Lingulodinium_polyedra.AAC.1